MVLPVPGGPGEHDVLSRVDGGHELVEHVGRVDHVELVGGLGQLLGGEAQHRTPYFGLAGRTLSAGWGNEVPFRRRTSSTNMRYGLLADHLDELVAHGLVHRFLGHEGLGRVGAPPVELLAALAPVAALPLADGRGDVPVDVGLVDPAQGQLPADLGLPVEGPLVPAQRRLVQRAAGAGGEPGTVEEDAGPVDDAGDRSRRRR